MAKCMSSAVKFTSWCVYLKENWDAGGKWSGCSRGHVDGFFVKITEHISFGWSRQFEALSHYSLSDARSLPSNSITIVSSLIDDRYLSLFELYFSHFSINRDWWRRKLSLSLSMETYTILSLSSLVCSLCLSLTLEDSIVPLYLSPVSVGGLNLAEGPSLALISRAASNWRWKFLFSHFKARSLWRSLFNFVRKSRSLSTITRLRRASEVSFWCYFHHQGKVFVLFPSSSYFHLL